ncbi:MAG: sugar kinase [Hyphomonadaceae bacterium]
MDEAREFYRGLSQTEAYLGAHAGAQGEDGAGDAPSGGRLVMLMSAQGGEGVSSLAASLALAAAEHARKPTWLLDLDLRRNHAFNAFAVGALSMRYGGVGPPYSALLKTDPFFTIEPEDKEATGMPGLFTAHRVGETRMMVTQFDADRLQANAMVRIRTQPSYWAAVRGATDWTVVDAPALARSNAGLAVASQMDGVVLVVQADRTPASEVAKLRQAVERHGGRVLGVALTRIQVDARLVESIG